MKLARSRNSCWVSVLQMSNNRSLNTLSFLNWLMNTKFNLSLHRWKKWSNDSGLQKMEWSTRPCCSLT